MRTGPHVARAVRGQRRRCRVRALSVACSRLGLEQVLSVVCSRLGLEQVLSVACSRFGCARGETLPGALVALAAVALAAGFGGSMLAPAWRHEAVRAAAHGLAARMQGLRARAVREGCDTALVFPAAGSGDEPILEVRDGDGDGVGRTDLAAGREVVLDRFTLARDIEGASVGLPTTLPLPPPSTGIVPAGSSGVRFGTTRIAGFGRDGHATPGTLFVRAGDDVCAVVVAGGTGRVRVVCFESGRWVVR